MILELMHQGYRLKTQFTRTSLEKVYSISKYENNIEYSSSIKKFLTLYSDSKFDPKDLIIFFDDTLNTDTSVN